MCESDRVAELVNRDLSYGIQAILPGWTQASWTPMFEGEIEDHSRSETIQLVSESLAPRLLVGNTNANASGISLSWPPIDEGQIALGLPRLFDGIANQLPFRFR